MNTFIRKPIVVFFITAFILSAIFFLIPVEVFDGEYIYNVNGITAVREAKLSLSYFIGIGSPKETMYLVSYKLVPMGYFMVFLFLFALPILIAYRVHLANQQSTK